jgi:hypothetical protein
LRIDKLPFSLGKPSKWKKHFGLTADKNEALEKARKLFPKGKLKLKEGHKQG